MQIKISRIFTALTLVTAVISGCAINPGQVQEPVSQTYTLRSEEHTSELQSH